jgi:thiol-disulfide isomerase/thioredoxin
MKKLTLSLIIFASLASLTRSSAQSGLAPLEDQTTPPPVPSATPEPLPLLSAAPVAGEWLTNQEEAIDQAIQQGKVILVDFDADWCSWCTKLDHDVLSQEPFKAFGAAHLILLKMDYPVPEFRRSPAAVTLLNRCNVKVFPTLLLMKPDGAEIARYSGYAREPIVLQWLKTNVPDPEAVDSAPSEGPLVKGEETGPAPGERQTSQMQTFITAMAKYDWRTLEPYFIDGQTNYFGHRHASVHYIINDIINDSRQFGRQNWTVYWDTFKHETDGDLTYDSVNAYVVIQEPGVRTHRASERLTIGYAPDPSAAHGIIIYSLALKVLPP